MTLFEAVKEAVPVPEAPRLCGLNPNGSGIERFRAASFPTTVSHICHK